MKATPGAELACRGKNYDLPVGQNALPRGVVSFYATVTLADAGTIADWLTRIEAVAQQDVLAGALPRLYRPELHVLGDINQHMPGKQS